MPLLSHVLKRKDPNFPFIKTIDKNFNSSIIVIYKKQEVLLKQIDS